VVIDDKMKNITPYTIFKPFTFLIIIGYIFNILGIVSIDTLLPWLLKILIDNVFPNKNIQLLLIVLSLILVTRILGIFFIAIQMLVNETVRVKASNNLKLLLIKKIRELKYYNFKKYLSGDLLSYISNDVPYFIEIYYSLLDIFCTLFGIILQLAIVFIINPLFALIGLILLVLFPLINYLTTKKIRGKSIDKQNQYGEMNAIFNESISGSKEIISYVCADWENKRFLSIFNNILKSELNIAKIFMTRLSTDGFLRLIFELFLYGYAGYQVIRGEISVGIAVASITYFSGLVQPISVFGGSFAGIRMQMGICNEMRDCCYKNDIL
jgi:ABC-type multidrug transport system fused ATPase/permease subunit